LTDVGTQGLTGAEKKFKMLENFPGAIRERGKGEGKSRAIFSVGRQKNCCLSSGQ
jgi:hypothetical protein